MFKLVEWLVMVVLPASCAVLLSVGFLLHLTGRLGLALRLIAPPRRGDRAPAESGN